MSSIPEFPTFRSLEPEDRGLFNSILGPYDPEVSELTFTNLFIWRAHYRFQWSLYRDWLCILGEDEQGLPYVMEPVGPSPRGEVALMLLRWMREQNHAHPARMERVDKRLVKDVEGIAGIEVEPLREHFDYLYLRSDLAELAGNRYRSKRNHINKLSRSYSFAYAALGNDHMGECLELQETWCTQRRCEDDLNLMGEWEAIREILANYERFELRGGVILVDGKVEAFTVGELLNHDTAVIHVEKANADIPGLYTIINQQCCEKCWAEATYINREQDLGVPGLREAKLSYCPHHLVEKFRLTLT
jgi:uncharacterized protein